MFHIFLGIACISYIRSHKVWPGRILYRRGSSNQFVYQDQPSKFDFLTQADAIAQLGEPDTCLESGDSKLLIWYYSESYNTTFINKLHRSARVYILLNPQGKVVQTKVFYQTKATSNKSGLINS